MRIEELVYNLNPIYMQVPNIDAIYALHMQDVYWR